MAETFGVESGVEMGEVQHPVLGTGPDGQVLIDVAKLLRSRLLIQANSGAGKSWALRRLIEQCYGQTQIIVLDREGEFYTLREKFDFILAGKDGECPADLKSASKLATRLLELGVSAIVDIYELAPADRIEFVSRFLRSMLNARRSLWHDCLVIIDEADVFAPQASRSGSLDAVVDLMARGRKRGFCGVLATQRISKLNKDAAAEAANNKLIGRTALDVDLKRAGDELGMARGDWGQLKLLKPGQFYAFGPAISDTVVEVTIGPIETSHPEPGERALPTPPPRETVKAVLGQLADLPHEIEREERTIEALEKQLRDMRRELRLAEQQRGSPVVDEAALEQAAAHERRLWEGLIESTRSEHATALRTLRAELAAMREMLPQIVRTANDVESAIDAAAGRVEAEMNRAGHIAIQPPESQTRAYTPNLARAAEPVGRKPRAGSSREFHGTGVEPSRSATSNGLPTGAHRMLMALAIRYPMKFTKSQWGTLSRLKHTGGTFSTYLSKLRTAEFVETDGNLFAATERGLAHAGVEPAAPSSPEERIEMWRDCLSGKVLEMFDWLASMPGQAVTREQLADAVSLTAGAGTFSTYLSKLSANQLVEKLPGGMLMAARHLFAG